MKNWTSRLLIITTLCFGVPSMAVQGRGGDGPDPLMFETASFVTSDGQLTLTLAGCNESPLQCRVQLSNSEDHAMLARGRIVHQMSSIEFLIRFLDSTEKPFWGFLRVSADETAQLRLVGRDRMSQNFFNFTGL